MSNRITIALFLASAVAIGTASTWMMSTSASPASSPAPVAQAQAQPAPQTTPAPAAAPAASATSAVQTPTAAPTPKQASAPAAAAAPTSAPVGSAGQQAHIDPKTGQLRPAEHDDAAAIASKAGQQRGLARRAAAEPQQFATENAIGVAVPDEVQPYTVATVTPDGKVVIEHVQGGKAAADKVRKNSAKGGLTHRKEEPNDR